MTSTSPAISVVTLFLGAVVLAWGLAIPPGDPGFYAATGALALVWLGGALLARRAAGRPLRPDAAGKRPARHDLLLGVATGTALTAAFLVGAGLVTQLPSLRSSLEELLDHATEGITGVVLLLTLLNGVAEELFFRGVLFDALVRFRPVVMTTLVYTLVVLGSGVWMLGLAGVLVGGAAALLRQRTGGTTASIVAHLIWSLGMFFLLPPALTHWS